MAPRGGGGRGGGSSGGSGGGGSSRNGAGSSAPPPPNPWKMKIKLPGSHFKDSVAVASIAFICILFLALIGIFIWSSRIKSRGSIGSRGFKSGGLRLALMITGLAYAFRITDLFLHEFEVIVTNYYAIFYIISLFFTLCAVIAAVFVIYSVATHYLRQSSGKSGAGSLRWVHLLVLVVLSGLLIANMYYYIRYQIASVKKLSTLTSTRKGYGRVDTAFYIVVLLAAVEVFALSVMTLIKSRRTVNPGAFSLFLVLVVALPFLLRGIVDVALAIKYALPTSVKTIPKGVSLVHILLVDLPTVVAFAGIVIVGTRQDPPVKYVGAPKSMPEPVKEPLVTEEYQGAYAQPAYNQAPYGQGGHPQGGYH